MARIIYDDGLDVVERLDQDSPLDELIAYMKNVGGFESKVRAAEQFWIAEANRLRVVEMTDLGKLVPLTRQWYARTIPWIIGIGRNMIASAPDRERSVIAGILIGQYVTEAVWRFNRGALTKTGLRRRQVASRSGKVSGEKRRARNYPRVEARARELRQQHSDPKKYSTRRLADRISRDLKISFNTVKDILAKRHIK